MKWDGTLYKALVGFMKERGWRRKLAKRDKYMQSLFDHSIGEVDVFLAMRSIFADPSAANLNEEEQQATLLAVALHDAGKEDEAWQKRLVSPGPFVEHIRPDLVRQLAPQLGREIGADSIDAMGAKVVGIITAFHHKRSRRDAAYVSATFEVLQDAGLRRWKVCADIVDAIDNVCSANGLLSAQHAFDRSLLSDYARSAHHHVQLRGVSTPLLHGAASAAFTTADWLPLLHYREGTLYAQMRAGRAVTPSRDDVKQQLVALLDVAIGKDVAKLVVGSPTANIMPKPDLIDHRETRQYLTAAANKIGRTSFARKTASDRRTVAIAHASSGDDDDPHCPRCV